MVINDLESRDLLAEKLSAEKRKAPFVNADR
jgi:hypothetical protein